MPDTTTSPTALHPVVEAVTRRIRERSVVTRTAYLAQVEQMANRKPGADRMGCANVAHAFAAMPDADKTRVTGLDKLTDADWEKARAMIKTQNEKDRAGRSV